MRKLTFIAFMAMAIAAASFTFPQYQTSSVRNPSAALLLPDDFVGRCNVCNWDDICGVFRVFVEEPGSSVVVSVQDVLNGPSYSATGTFSWVGSTRYVTNLSFSTPGLGPVTYTGPLTYTW
jgi:hypothetical protein